MLRFKHSTEKPGYLSFANGGTVGTLETIYHDSKKEPRIDLEIHCCERIIQDFGKIKTYIFKKPCSKIPYNLDEKKKWVGLIKTYVPDFENSVRYIIDEGNEEDTIIMEMTNSSSLATIYTVFLLYRYLWYPENDGLILRTFDILDSGQATSFISALKLAHYYDNIYRVSTFNLFYSGSFLNLSPIIHHPSVLEPFSINFKQLYCNLESVPKFFNVSPNNILSYVLLFLSNAAFFNVVSYITKENPSYEQVKRRIEEVDVKIRRIFKPDNAEYDSMQDIFVQSSTIEYYINTFLKELLGVSDQFELVFSVPTGETLTNGIIICRESTYVLDCFYTFPTLGSLHLKDIYSNLGYYRTKMLSTGLSASLLKESILLLKRKDQ